MMINDTEKKNGKNRRNAFILLGACAFALALGAIAQVATDKEDPLAQMGTSQDPATSHAIETVPQDVEKSTANVGWTPDEFASLADSIFEEESSFADAVFGNTTEDATQTVAVDGKPVDGPASVKKEYMLPAGTDIVKDFSMGIPVFSDTMNDWRTHNGVDFGGKEGDSVVAAADATVTAVYEDASWGGVIELDFGNGATAKYCGLQFDSITLAVGDTVKQGETVGVLGKIPVEAKEGCHLHYEMRMNGEIADPLEVMGRGGTDE
ncbi:MAG: M23 family metallopeptidase [Clostridia bacterium]|nr:M23 family metallopeptidase [Clostridia bacterium]